jgi:hypothetical protein
MAYTPRDIMNKIREFRKELLEKIEELTGGSGVTEQQVNQLISQAPINSATSTGLSAKVDKTTTVAGKALSANITLVKGDVGLGNLDNTTDLNKPISTANQTALDAKMAKTGAVNESVDGNKTFTGTTTLAVVSLTADVDPSTNNARALGATNRFLSVNSSAFTSSGSVTYGTGLSNGSIDFRQGNSTTFSFGIFPTTGNAYLQAPGAKPTEDTTAKLWVAGLLRANAFRQTNFTPPATAAAAGVAGNFGFDSGFLYYCVASGQWVRVALATW